MNDQVGPLEAARIAGSNPWAALLGGLGGAFVPITSFALVHGCKHLNPLQWALVGSCLLYSSDSVWHWKTDAIGNRFKAACWVVLVEGAMIAGGISWLSWLALGFLVYVNASHSATVLARRDVLDKARARLDLHSTAEEVLGDPAGASVTVLPVAARDAGVVALAPSLGRESRELEFEDLYQRAVELVMEERSCSISGLRRVLNIGHSRAVKIVSRMEAESVVGPETAAGRAVIAVRDRFSLGQ